MVSLEAPDHVAIDVIAEVGDDVWLTASQSEETLVTRLFEGVLVARGSTPSAANTSVIAELGFSRRSYHETLSRPLLSAFRTAGKKCRALVPSLLSFTGADWTAIRPSLRSEGSRISSSSVNAIPGVWSHRAGEIMHLSLSLSRAF